MYLTLLFLHNLLRWIILILLIIVIVKAYRGWRSRKIYSKSDKKLALFLMTAAHIQFLIGLYQWIAGPWGLQLILNQGMQVVMKNGAFRFWAIEHITGMFIAITLITVGRSVTKKPISDMSKFKRSFWMFFFALLIIVASVPWPGRKNVERPLVPGTTIGLSHP